MRNNIGYRVEPIPSISLHPANLIMAAVTIQLSYNYNYGQVSEFYFRS